MARVINFSPGPATLPEPVLERVREELLDFRGTGMSVVEMSHRGKVFIGVAEAAEAALRRLLSITDDYTVLFLQGGATLQFASVPMNLSTPGERVGYVNTGAWSAKAIKEARAYCDVVELASSEETNFDRAPEQATWSATDELAYVHFTPNETIHGVEYHWTPELDQPLVADMSSNILSAPIDVDRFGLIYAGAQKNIGVSGITVVIVRSELLGRARAGTPTVMNYALQAGSDSMLNTPSTFAWYVAGLVFEWLEGTGGLSAMAERNHRKANTLYTALDASNFYRNPVRPVDRSIMNVPFTLADPGRDAAFLEGAEAAGLSGLKGHRAVGGMRASLYNAMPQSGVDALVEYLHEFERTQT
ncbi:MAG: 3-phosphoserine/phosphohydroxythreonine transaminase [Pseudomonadota bacterium]